MARNRKTQRAAPAKAPRRKSVKPSKQRSKTSGRGREITGIVGLGLAIFLLASLVSLQVGDGSLMGPLGRASAATVYGVLGICSYLLVVSLGAVFVRMLMGKRPPVGLAEGSAVGLAVVAIAVIAHLAGGDYRVAGAPAGGGLGAFGAESLRALVSTAGTVLLAAIALVVAALVATPLRVWQLWRAIWTILCAAGAAVASVALEVGRFCGEVIRAILPERDRDEYLDDEDDEDLDDFDEDLADAADDPPIIEPTGDAGVAYSDAGDDGMPSAVPDAAPATAMDAGDTERLDNAAIAEIVSDGRKSKRSKGKRSKKRDEAALAEPPPAAEASVPAEAKAAAAAAPARSAEPEDEPAEAETPAAEAPAEAPPQGAAPAPKIVESTFMSAKKRGEKREADGSGGEELDFIPLAAGSYKLPPTSLLREDEGQTSAFDRQAMLELSAKLTQTLENYRVKGQVTAIRPGPVVTMYEFSPAPGTRIQKIVNLSDDLAMALEALRVRIVAPIPGKAAVGIEVPNKTRETVYLKEILADDTFQTGKSKLPLAMGKDIEGAPAVVDLAKMPHLLVAGTTGSGKSVAVNAMITSLLYSASPEEVRMIMVDPKMLELSIYEGIPHLLLPVVTDPKKANLALRWGVEEMERRYDLLAGMGVRDIASYNRKVEKLTDKYEAERARRQEEAEAAAEAEADDEGDHPVDITQERAHPGGDLETPPTKLPYLVIVIDEFADLMMCAPKEVETSVARIAQKARAAGIHLVLATQRPSVDVITGLIKANFPSRCAFHVTSKIDSRTVLDQGGAEALLGLGDMLFSDRGGAPKRYHGCFVDEDEVHGVVEFLKAQGRPVYNMDILNPREDDGEGGDGGGEQSQVDEMYDRAVALVAETRQASISMIQRRLRVGYNRAARMVEQMEKQGVVGPPDGTNKREVLISAA